MADLGLTAVRDPRRLSVKVYDQLFHILTRPGRIGVELPPEIDLARDLAVSRSTLRQALALLEEDGVLVRGAGRRRIVAPRRPAQLHSNHTLEEMVADSGEVSVEAVGRRILPATRWASELLAVDVGTSLTVWESLVSIQGVGIVASALELTPRVVDRSASSDATTLLAALGATFRLESVQTTLRLAPHTADTRTDFHTLDRSRPSVVLTQVLTVGGEPAYLAKHAVRLDGVRLDISGESREPGARG